jgi:hypothetical protein
MTKVRSKTQTVGQAERNKILADIKRRKKVEIGGWTTQVYMTLVIESLSRKRDISQALVKSLHNS